MSFLSIVDSIGGKNASSSSPQAIPKPSFAKPRPTDAPSTKITQYQPAASDSAPSLKRKAEDNVASKNLKVVKPQPSSATGVIGARKPAAPPLHAPRPQTEKSGVPKSQPNKVSKEGSSKPSTPTASAAKPPPSKGSFAELMARAKAQNPQQKIGVIKHTKTAPKEKLSKREERKRTDDQVKKERSGSGGGSKPEGRRSISPANKGVQTGRVSKAASSRPTYKGTLGMSASRDRSRQEQRSRNNEYLGTDEEDNSDLVDDYDEESYESSDMEGGFDDLEMEEAAALRLAKADDAREQALENQLKREKEERRRRLEALANRRK